MLSLWSAVDPGVWVTRGTAEGGTFTISGNARIDDSTNPTPFWNSESPFWVSSETKTTETLQYSYPEFNSLPSDSASIQTAIATYINQKYGGGGFSSRTPSVASAGPVVSFLAHAPAASGAPAQPAPTPHAATPTASAPAPAAAGSVHPFASQGGSPQTAVNPGPGHEAPQVVQDWTVRIHFKKYELGQSVSVLIFLGDVPADASQWRTSPTFVGAHASFVTPSTANNREQQDSVTEGFVHLNEAITRLSGLTSFEPNVVIPYLKENLQWRAQASNRTAVDLDRLPSLEVTVAAVPLTHPPGAIFPIAGDPHYYHHITHGRQGGARHAQA